MNDNNQNSDSTETTNHDEMSRAKRNRKFILAIVLASYAINMVLGTYYIFTNHTQDAVRHIMFANISCLFIIDQAIK